MILLLLLSNLIQFQHEEEISDACIDDWWMMMTMTMTITNHQSSIILILIVFLNIFIIMIHRPYREMTSDGSRESQMSFWLLDRWVEEQPWRAMDAQSNSRSYRLMMQLRRGTEKLSIGKLLELKLRLIYRVVVVALFPINLSDLSELKLLYSIKMGESQISVSQLDIWLISYDIDEVLLWLISNSKEIVLLTALIIY